MENLLSKRLKNLIFILPVIVIFFIIIFLILPNFPQLNEEKIFQLVIDNLKGIENLLEKEVNLYQNRAQVLFHRYQNEELQHADLEHSEAILKVERGIVTKYFGEIFYFKFRDIKVGAWILLSKNVKLYYLQRLAKNIFYIKYFCHIQNNFMLKECKYDYTVKELKFFDKKIPTKVARYQYDEVKDMYFYFHVLKNSQKQLVLFLRFSKQDIASYYKQNRNLYFFILLLILFSLGVFYIILKKLRTKTILLQLSILVVFFILFIIMSIIGQKNIFLNFLNFRFFSLYQVLIVVIFLTAGLFILLKKFQKKIFACLLFNISFVFMFIFIKKLLNSANFNYGEFVFNLNYLTLIFIVFLLHLIPLIIIKNIGVQRKIRNFGFLILIQLLFFILYFEILKTYYLSFIIFSLIIFILIFFRRRFLWKFSILFLLAISIFSMTFTNTEESKREFVSKNLKNIFLNQANYAKLIAREIVYEINSYSNDFRELFREGMSAKIEEIWRTSLAYKENVASGIFVLSNQGEIVNSFSYQIPYIEVKKKDFFPFWSVEGSRALLFGKEISLAIASLDVFHKSEHMGRIIIQVVDSPELILKNRENINVFTIDKKIQGLDLSYIKISRENKILENPSNINLKNIGAILKYDNDWIHFRYMDFKFNGYIFRSGDNYIIIFYAKNTVVKNLSEIIKISLFLLLFFILFYFRELKVIEWKSIYYSFSIKVFAILILIAFFTAIVFAIFSLNFNYRLSERHLRQIIYEEGRTAQKLVNNILSEEGEFNRNHLFLLANLIDNEVNIYQNGILLFTSNYRKIIQSQIPIYLHSNILTVLNKRNQKFDLIKEGELHHLYFKIYDYIFNIDFSFQRSDILLGKETYIDFLFALFFILVISGFSSALFFRNKIMAPIYGLNKGMSDVEKGNLHPLENIPSEFELRNLYLGFNSMVEGIVEQKKNVSEIARMKTLVKLGRRVAHEIKNPLTPIKLSAEQIDRSLKDKGADFEGIIEKSVKFIIDETEHLKKVSHGFLDLSKLDELNVSQFDLMSLIREQVNNFQQLYANIEFMIESSNEVMPVSLDQIKISQIIKNVLVNAIEAVGEDKGNIKVIIKEQEKISINIIDNGFGMEEDEVNSIFNEDFSTKEIGSGLGLVIVKRNVELHNGHIEINSKKNIGTQVSIILPKNFSKPS